MRYARIFTGVCVMLFLSSSVFAAVFTVTKTADTNDGLCDADCSLREAVAAANIVDTNDTLYFSLGVFGSPQTITLSGTEIVIAANGSLTIIGTGANRLTISGNNASRIFSVSDNAVVNISYLFFTRGNGAGAANTGRGGAIYNNGGTTEISKCVFNANSAMLGGAMNNATAGTLTIRDSNITGNQATSVGGALQNFSTSTLHLINTAINYNTAGTSTTGGGAIQGNGTITMTNVTMSANSTQASGGAIYYNGTGLTMTNTTISNNTAATNAGGVHKSTATNNANIRNSIIAGNTGGASPDVTNVINSLGNNIIGTVGTSTGWVATDLQNTNPLLVPFGNNGGNGLTHALLSGSPALNGGQNCVITRNCLTANSPVFVDTDQRGASRFSDATVDIGAFEASNSYRAVLPSARLNQIDYGLSIASGYPLGAFTFAVTSGSLPPGMYLIEASDLAPLSASIGISGTPTQTGAFNFAITTTGGMNTSVVNYQLNVLNNLSFVPVRGRLGTSPFPTLANGFVRLTEINSGNVYTTRTNGFGYYSFTDIPAGGTYIFSIGGKIQAIVPDSPPETIIDAVDDFVLH